MHQPVRADEPPIWQFTPFSGRERKLRVGGEGPPAITPAHACRPGKDGPPRGPGEGVASLGHRDLARDEDIPDVRELQTFLRVLLDHHDGLAVCLLEVAEDLENHVDEAGREAEGRLIDQQDTRLHQYFRVRRLPYPELFPERPRRMPRFLFV